MKCKVILEPSGKQFLVEKDSSLSDVLKGTEVEFPCGSRGVCGKCKVKLLSGDINLDERHKAILVRMGLSEEWRLACYSNVSTDITIEIPSGGMKIQSDTSKIRFQPEEGYGIAVDLGSTTIVIQLIDLTNGEILATRSGINSQSHYGSDIISRISYSMESVNNAKCLMYCVREFIGSEIEEMISAVPLSKVKRVVIAGNTVMHHLFSGIDVSPLAVAPFQSEHNQSMWFSPSDLGWNVSDSCMIEFLPNLSHFVGSDVLCGIQACDMLEKNKYSLLVDLGTNGEIALVCNGKVICTSTAAGPAFEGINISCGMRATDGAIYSASNIDGKFSFKTVGNVEPKGLCGSGLVEVVHTLFDMNLVDYTGAFVDEKTFVSLSDSVKFTIADIREFQLAKAALSAGISLILKKNGISPSQIDNVYITGGLGNYLNVEKAKSLGLLREFPSEKIVKIENASLAGCRELLFSSNRSNISNITENCEFFALESDSDFQDVFCDNLYFNIEK